LLQDRSRIVSLEDDERALTQAFVAQGKQTGWSQAPGYLLRSLASHAARAGMIDALLTDDGYLLHADLRRLVALADGTTNPAAQQRVRLLRLTPRAITASPQSRTALFSVTECLENLGHSYTTSSQPAPYRGKWAFVRPRTERAVLEGHSSGVTAICGFSLGGHPLLASSADGRTVRIWDPATGHQQAVLEGHTGAVRDICAFSLGGRTLLASGGTDRVVRIWDAATGSQQAVLEGHRGPAWAVCGFSLGGRALLASGASDTTVRIWDPATGAQQAVLEGHTAGCGQCAA
jgi:WD40 repeat protein